LLCCAWESANLILIQFLTHVNIKNNNFYLFKKGLVNLKLILILGSFFGIICLVLTLRMAHKSLILKLEARNVKRPIQLNRQTSTSTDNLFHLLYQEQQKANGLDDSSNKSDCDNSNYESAEMKMVDFEDDQIKDQNSNFSYKRPKSGLTRSSSAMSIEKIDTRVDKVYTVGCFDLFHHGHIKLIERMREIGKKVIVGVHDSRRLVNSLLVAQIAFAQPISLRFIV